MAHSNLLLILLLLGVSVASKARKAKVENYDLYYRTYYFVQFSIAFELSVFYWVLFGGSTELDLAKIAVALFAGVLTTSLMA